MDAEDESNSYLKYLNDSDTPNTYLLENNEVGLFSVEPIFTEMEATDWPQEGFPLLLTNSLITDESTEHQDASSQHSNNVVNESTVENNKNEDELESLQEVFTTNNGNVEIQNVIEIEPSKNEVQLTQNGLQLGENYLNIQDVSENNVQLSKNAINLNENCIQLVSNGISETSVKNLANKSSASILEFKENGLQLGKSLQYLKNNTVVPLKPDKKNFIILDKNKVQSGSLIKLAKTVKIPITAKDGSMVKSINVSENTQTLQKKIKNVNDLFSTVIANKCKICGFLCEDLEQIKRHISEKHPEYIFTHNGLSSGISLLLTNAKKNDSQKTEEKKEFTVFICSECHGVCTDKDDLKQHMIQVHHLTTEYPKTTNSETKTTNLETKVKPKETKPIYQETSVLSDVNIGLVKQQEKAVQKVKCQVPGCIATFPSEELSRNHKKLHIGETKNHFKCQECDQTFMLWRIARSHMYKEHNIDFGMIVCPMCSVFKSYIAARILRHMVIHVEEKPFQCQECGKSYKQLSQLKNHEIMHKTPEDMPTWCRVKKCDKCQSFFANSKSLKTHMKAVHENFKPFICNICGHKSSRKAMLEMHSRQHTGKKPHECKYCNYKTGDHNCLRRHMMKHVGAVAYQCPYCPYRCIQAGSYKNHLAHKHKGQSGAFSCKYCPYTTINPLFLNSHEKNHEISLTEGTQSDKMDDVEREKKNETDMQTDEETQSCFLNIESQIEETVDNGGITIPAGQETHLVL